jgi:hypothetical protein
MGLNIGLRVGLAGVVLIGHLYTPSICLASVDSYPCVWFLRCMRPGPWHPLTEEVHLFGCLCDGALNCTRGYKESHFRRHGLHPWRCGWGPVSHHGGLDGAAHLHRGNQTHGICRSLFMHEDPPVPLLAGDTTTALVPTPPHHAFRHAPPPSLACRRIENAFNGSPSDSMHA